MKVSTFNIQGPLLLEPKSFADDRGFFTERFSINSLSEAGIKNSFIQDNYSLSKPRVLRGLHYQFSPPQGKLVTCTSGQIFDVAVDIRKRSATYGQWISAVLDAAVPRWLWVPAGFAHGFCVIGDEPAGVLYKVDCGWSKGGEAGIMWNDPEIGIKWPISDPILSSKDAEMMTFQQYSKAPSF